MAEQEHDYLAIVNLMAGAGSFARGPDRDDVLKRVKRILKQDWKSLYKFKKGTVIKANLIDVNGGDQVTWGFDGIYVDGKPFEGKVELVEIVY